MSSAWIGWRTIHPVHSQLKAPFVPWGAMQNYRFCYRITNIVTSQPYVLIISYQLHPVHRIWTHRIVDPLLLHQQHADQKLTLTLVQAGNLDLVHALSVVYPVLYGVYYVKANRHPISIRACVHIFTNADEAWQYCSGIWTNHISLGRRVYDPSGRFLHLARFYQIISSKYPILSIYHIHHSN